MFDGPFDLFAQQMVSNGGSCARVCHAECPDRSTSSGCNQAAGDHPSECMIAKLLKQNPDPWMRTIIKNGLGVIYGGTLANLIWCHRICTDRSTRTIDFQPEQIL